MTTYFPAELQPQLGEKPAKRRSKRRLLRITMRQRAGELLSQLGYALGDPLRIPRAISFQAECNGKPLKIGIRASADRWVALTQPALADGGELRIVNQLVVITFANPKVRDSIQLWRFDAAVVAQMGRKIFEASGTTGQQWLPLDDAQDAGVHSMVAGSLAKHGTLLVEEAVEWGHEISSPAQPASSPSMEPRNAPRKLTIEEAKAGLAAQFGVSPASIRITIEG